MGKLTDYINRLYKDLERQKDLLNQNDDEFERVDIEYEIMSLEEEITNASNTLEKFFKGEDILTFANEIMTEEEYNKAVTTYKNRIETMRNAYIKDQEGIVKSREISIKQLKYRAPNYEDENDPQHKYYLELLNDIAEANENIANPKPKPVSFVALLDQKYLEAMIKKIVEKAEELDNIDKVADELESFLPKDKSNKDVKFPVKDSLGKIAFGINTSSEVKNIILENENLINELTAEDSNASTNKMYNSKVAKIEPLVEDKVKKIFVEAVKEYKLEDITDFSDHAFSKIETKEQLDRVYNDDLKFEYSLNTKRLFTELLKEMEYRNMIPEDAKAKEDKVKCYGFTNFAKARTKFIEVINAQEFNNDEFMEAWNNLNKETNNIEAMYKAIDKKLGTSYESMPTNVDTYRTNFIPRRFKQNVAHNAQLGGLYITLSFIKSHNLTIEEFMEDPAGALKKAIKEDSEKLIVDKAMKDKTKAEVIFTLSDPMYQAGIDVYGYIRAVDFLNGIESDPALKRKNSMITMGLLNGFGRYKRAIEAGQRLFNYGNVNETIKNVFLAEKNEETGEIPYNECFSEQVGRTGKDPVEFEEFVDKLEDPNTGFLRKDKPTSLDKVADMFLFEEKFYEMMITIKQYKNCVKNPENAGKLQNITIKNLVTAAQELTAQYLLTHDVKEMNKMYDNVIGPEFLKEMTDFIKNPRLQTALNGVDVADMGNPTLEKMIKDKDSLFAKKEKRIRKFIKEEMKVKDDAYLREVKEINQTIDELDKQADAISKEMGKAGKGLTNDRIEAIAMRQRELMNQLLVAQDKRIEELRKDYENGKIPKYFYEKRVEQLATGNIKDLANIPPLFKVDDPAYKNFNTYMRQVVSKMTAEEREGKTEEDFRSDYKEVMYNARIEKSTYLADRVLAEKGIRAAKSLDSANEFTVPTAKLDLNESVYKEEFVEYKDHNNDKIVNIEVPEAIDDVLLIDNQAEEIGETIEVIKPKNIV